MNDLLEQYTALSSSSPQSDVSNVMNSIINAPPLSFNATFRKELIKNLVTDLQSCGSKGRLTARDAAQVLLAVKTLGKHPSGSEFLATPQNLSTLLTLSSNFKDNPDASSEALRCIANALLLIEQGRSTFLEKEVDGGTTCLLMLEKSTMPDQIFILARILFLSTASCTSYIETVVESKYHGRTFVEMVASKLDFLTTGISSGVSMAREAMTDLLKFTFNILLYYPKLVDSEPQSTGADAGQGSPKVMGDLWNSKLDGLLAPLLRAFMALPPTSPCPVAAPLTHVIHALINIPVSTSLRPIWFAVPSTPSSRHSPSHSPKSPISQTPQHLDSSLPGSRSDSPTRISQGSASPKLSTFDRALSVLNAGRKSLSRSSSPTVTTSLHVFQKSLDLLDLSFSHYFPGDIESDDPLVRELCRKESPDSLDDTLSPLIVLITRFCIGDEQCRARLRQFIVPDDMDRSTPLEGRPDFLGRCLRLLSSVYHPRLKDSVGEMLYAMSDSNATTLSALFGYGNVAGFLFHKGVLTAPAQDAGSTNIPRTTPKGEVINPITGTTSQPTPSLAEMTDEEKEIEMEKLVVLFDRLEKTGALPKEQNPIRKAIQQGKLGNS